MVFSTWRIIGNPFGLLDNEISIAFTEAEFSSCIKDDTSTGVSGDACEGHWVSEFNTCPGENPIPV